MRKTDSPDEPKQRLVQNTTRKHTCLVERAIGEKHVDLTIELKAEEQRSVNRDYVINDDDLVLLESEQLPRRPKKPEHDKLIKETNVLPQGHAEACHPPGRNDFGKSSRCLVSPSARLGKMNWSGS
jgi:hypothetical protein